MSEPLFPPAPTQRDFALTNKLLYAWPKTGKTTLMSHFRDKTGRPPLFIMTEDGEGELVIQRARVKSWPGFLTLLSHLEANKSRVQIEHSFFCIDLVGDLDEMCTAYICEQNHVNSLGDLDFGKGFAAQKKAFKEAMFRLMALLPVSFIAHSQEKEIEADGTKRKTQCPSLSKGCMEFVNGKVDTIMWIAPASLKQEYPEIIVQNSIMCVAGSRYPQLIGRYKYDPKNIPATVRAIQDAFEKAAPPTPPIAAVVATTESPATPTP